MSSHEEDETMEMASKTQSRKGEEGTNLSAEALSRFSHLDRLATASVLAGGLAHEIANPLASLRSALDALHEGLARTGLGVADARRGGSLAADLDVARLSAGAIGALIRDYQIFLRPDEITPVLPNVELRPAIERAIVMARAKVVALSALELELGDAPAVRVPSTRITQIVLNLLFNAADALAGRPRGQNLIVVGLRALDGNAVIEVRDNGPGLPPHALRRLFEPGWTTKRSASSLGLGLAICSELVKASGGRISAVCPPPSGTTFRVVLPPADRPRL